MLVISPMIGGVQLQALNIVKASTQWISMTVPNFEAGGSFNRKKFSVSLGFKRAVIENQMLYSIWGRADTGGRTFMVGIESNKLVFRTSVDGINNNGVLITTATYSDSGYHHAHFIYDSDNATADDRIRMEVDGSAVSAFDSRTNPALSDELEYSNPSIAIGRDTSTGAGLPSFTGKIYLPSFFSGTIPANASIYSGGIPIRPTAAGLFSLLEVANGNITRDAVLSAAWVNTGGVTASTDVPT